MDDFKPFRLEGGAMPRKQSVSVDMDSRLVDKIQKLQTALDHAYRSLDIIHQDTTEVHIRELALHGKKEIQRCVEDYD